jgi:hypothetical protein
VKQSIQSPSASHSEQRRAHRFPVAVGRQLTVVEIAGQRFDGRVVNESASGLQVVVATDCELPLGAILQVLLDDIWLPVEVVHAEIAGDKTVAGLRRLQETFVNDDDVAGRQFILRDLMPAGIFFWLVTAALVGLVVIVVLAPTPEPMHPASRARTQPIATAAPASRRPATSAAQLSSSPNGARKVAGPNRVRKPEQTKPATINRRPKKPGAAPDTATPAETRNPGENRPRRPIEQSPPVLSIVDDPKLSAELGLDEAQRRALRKLQEEASGDADDQAALEVLTPQQREAWKQRQATRDTKP